MFQSKIFVATQDKRVLEKVRQAVIREGYQIVGEAADGNTAIRGIRSTLPALIIVDADLPGLNGMELARIAYEDNIAPAVVLLNNWQREHTTKGHEPWLISWLIKPVTDTNLISSIGIARSNFQRIQQLEKEVAELKETLETRKLVERAKGILMETKNISEGAAYKLIRKQSMNKCVSMRQVAEAIILAHDLGS
ncbi:ANTAR domain-containing protein [Metallumcola ferriviriculae]|uniref:Stage 0 sporulation protein A homolog n=1 Tax=Metallumcola ferriviriculae TaxID=3039180 RepID=A0AAU0UR53_9FIRM|nr:ANTAR domain-containing protein [Desulfitibacteraceae bacterium MK1]